MRIGVINQETWGFFNEVYAELSAHHRVTTFQPRDRKFPFLEGRINQSLARRDWLAFLNNQDVVFCEWASESLATITHLPVTARIITRLHRYELYNWADQVNWQAVDCVILVSEAKRREFAHKFPAMSDKLVVIPVGIDLQKFQQAPRAFNGNLGILGHLTPRKRVYELILAFSELAKKDSDYRLHIGGGKHPRFKDYYQALHRLVGVLGLDSQVVFYENVEQPAKWLSGIELFVSNGYSEGVQVAAMEAIAAGCYCLSHHWDGADELVPAECIFLTEQNFIARVSQYAGLSREEQLAKTAGLQAAVRERFDIQKVSVQIRQLVEDVASKPRVS